MTLHVAVDCFLVHVRFCVVGVWGETLCVLNESETILMLWDPA
jgi:hypothetical protein